MIENMNRVNFIALAVADLPRARAYYAALGWQEEDGSDQIAFFEAGGLKFSLFTLEGLSAETGLPVEELRAGRMTLAQNQPSPEAVQEAFDHAVACGATPVRAPFATDWGGHSCYVADPDGHLWEFAHNPFSPLDEAGHLA